MSALLSEVELLYEGCVTNPADWGERAFADWAEGIQHVEGLDKVSARYVRRCMNAGRKLAAFWSDRGSEVASDEWRSRVDVALGARAWRPLLDLAEHELERTGAEGAFVVVSGLFPLVRNQPYLDGVGYGEWLESESREER